MDTLFLLGGIIFGALGVLTVFVNDAENAPWWRRWAAWLLFMPAFTLLFYAFELFGVARAYALWAGGTAILVTIQSIRWGDKINMNQWFSISLVILGLIIFGVG